MWKRVLYVVFILFCIELGLFLLILPWTDIWNKNVLVSLFPRLRPWLLNDYARGGFSGLGLINLWVAFSDIWNFRRNMAALDHHDGNPPANPAAQNTAEGNERAPNPLLHH